VVAVAVDLHEQALGQGVDHRHAHPMQAAGHLVAATVPELAAGVQHGQHDFDGWTPLLLHDVHGDSTAVVHHGDGIVRVDRDGHLGGETGQSLVDRVVDDLIHEVVQPHHAGRADVHARALAHRLEALENGDVLRVVARGAARHRRVVDAALTGVCVRAFVCCGQ
jgi:hypothetical protein